MDSSMYHDIIRYYDLDEESMKKIQAIDINRKDFQFWELIKSLSENGQMMRCGVREQTNIRDDINYRVMYGFLRIRALYMLHGRIAKIECYLLPDTWRAETPNKSQQT